MGYPWLICWSERGLCFAGVCDSHPSVLYSITLLRQIVGAFHFGFEPELEYPDREPQYLLFFWVLGTKP